MGFFNICKIKASIISLKKTCTYHNINSLWNFTFHKCIFSTKIRVRTEWSYWKKNQSSLGYLQAHILCPSLRSRCLEVVGTRKNMPAMGRHVRGEGVPTPKAHENCFNLHSVSADTSNNFGWEAPERKSNCARRENCQLIVHGQCSEGLILHHQLLIPPNGITEVQVSEVTSIWFNGTKIYVAVISKKKWSVQTVFMMERIDIWYALAEVVGDKTICRIDEMKIRGNILCSGELGDLCCRWNAYHQNLDRIDEMKHLWGAWIWNTFH